MVLLTKYKYEDFVKVPEQYFVPSWVARFVQPEQFLGEAAHFGY